MQVEGDGVGGLQALEALVGLGAEQQAAAVGRVDVEPGAVTHRELGDRGQRVDGPEVGGPGGGDDGQRDLVAPGERVQGRAEGVGTHPAFGVGRDRDHAALAETEDRGVAGDGEVRLIGGEDAQPAGGEGRDAVEVGIGVEAAAQDLVAGEQQAHEVGLGPAGGQDAGAGAGVADGAGQGPDDMLLDLAGGGRLVPGVEGLVERGHRGLGGDADGEGRAVQVRGAVRMRGIGGAPGQEAAEGGEGLEGVLALVGQGAEAGGGDGVADGLRAAGWEGAEPVGAASVEAVEDGGEEEGEGAGAAGAGG